MYLRSGYLACNCLHVKDYTRMPKMSIDNDYNFSDPILCNMHDPSYWEIF